MCLVARAGPCDAESASTQTPPYAGKHLIQLMRERATSLDAILPVLREKRVERAIARGLEREQMKDAKKRRDAQVDRYQTREGAGAAGTACRRRRRGVPRGARGTAPLLDAARGARARAVEVVAVTRIELAVAANFRFSQP